jgi:hypothetical protein
MSPPRHFPGPPPGRAAEPAQKRLVVEALLAAWLACPALRLGQLLVGAHARSLPTGRGRPDLFDTEDDALADALDAMAEGAPPGDPAARTIPLPFPKKPLRAGRGGPYPSAEKPTMTDDQAPLDPYKTGRLLEAAKLAFAPGLAKRPDLALSIERDGPTVGFFVRPSSIGATFLSGAEREVFCVDNRPIGLAADLEGLRRVLRARIADDRDGCSEAVRRYGASIALLGVG